MIIFYGSIIIGGVGFWFHMILFAERLLFTFTSVGAMLFLLLSHIIGLFPRNICYSEEKRLRPIFFSSLNNIEGHNVFEMLMNRTSFVFDTCSNPKLFRCEVQTMASTLDTRENKRYNGINMFHSDAHGITTIRLAHMRQKLLNLTK